MTSSTKVPEAELRSLCESIVSKLEAVQGIYLEERELAKGFSNDEFENLLVGKGMAEAYLAGAITIHPKGLETLKKADHLILVWTLQKEGQS